MSNLKNIFSENRTLLLYRQFNPYAQNAFKVGRLDFGGSFIWASGACGGCEHGCGGSVGIAAL
jgi:hypothetical protein